MRKIKSLLSLEFCRGSSVASQNVWQLLNGHVVVGNVVSAHQQGELVEAVSCFQELKDLLGGDDALGALAVEKLGFKLLEGLLLAGKLAAHADIAATGTGCDKISDTGRFLGEGGGMAVLKERLAKNDHFKQTAAHDGSLGIVAPAETLDAASGNGDDVLEGASKTDTSNVLNNVDVEVRTVEQGVENSLVHVLALDVVSWQAVSHSGFTVLLLRNFKGKVGTRQGAAVDAQFPRDVLAQGEALLLGDVEALQARDGSGIGLDVALELVANVFEELVGHVEDNNVGVLGGVHNRGHGDEVLGQLDRGQVLDVLMLLVDDLGQVLAIDLFLMHPHANGGLENVRQLSGVFGHDLCHSSAPKSELASEYAN